jgi:hypothetical protein
VGVELIDKNGSILAEIFFCDKDNSISISVYRLMSGDSRLLIREVNTLLNCAMERISSFEDGTQVDWGFWLRERNVS